MTGGTAISDQSLVPKGCRSRNAGGRPLLVLLLLPAWLSACGPPEEARIEPSDRVAALPPPVLEPTGSFDAARARAEPEAEALQAEAEALSARAEALRARASALAQEPTGADAP